MTSSPHRPARTDPLAAALTAARHAAGLTQQQLADRSGISRPTIARVETGRASLGSARIWDWAAACGTTPADVFADAQGKNQ
ncbi:helix-turn-helix domain-containing protein [Gordonia sp. 852002-51296_SCH5728562-b]|uniref:helix-turn-helix domain-containing protein n=1 Tax=Gordonia sp. 852002-51296_SCH5728562-b TaxID=1834101 RepID=UPI000AD2DBAE|nr:helix-turn-helix transcriptional regulator [Gordonia sp. 852002-51296_SCH5728562-b]